MNRLLNERTFLAVILEALAINPRITGGCEASMDTLRCSELKEMLLEN